MPDVEFERAVLREPEQRRQVVAKEHFLRALVVAGEDRERLDELRLVLAPVLLEEALALDPLGHADHRERPVGEVRQHVRRHLREVAQETPLGERGLLERRLGRPVHAIEMRELERVPFYGEGEGVFLRLKLLKDACYFIGRFFLLRAGNLLYIDVIPQSQKDRRAQVPVLGPAVELELGDELRL